MSGDGAAVPTIREAAADHEGGERVGCGLDGRRPIAERGRARGVNTPKPRTAPVSLALYVPTFGQPFADDTEHRRGEAFELWTSPHGPCRMGDCDLPACGDSGLCVEHAT